MAAAELQAELPARGKGAGMDGAGVVLAPGLSTSGFSQAELMVRTHR